MFILIWSVPDHFICTDPPAGKEIQRILSVKADRPPLRFVPRVNESRSKSMQIEWIMTKSSQQQRPELKFEREDNLCGDKLEKKQKIDFTSSEIARWLDYLKKKKYTL